MEIHKDWIPHMNNWGYVVKSDKPMPRAMNEIIAKAIEKAVRGRRVK